MRLGVEHQVHQTHGRCLRAGVLDQHRAGNAAHERLEILLHRVGQRLEQREIRHGHAAAGLENAGDFGPNARLIRRQVEHAVGNHNIDAGIGDGKILNLTKPKLDIGVAGSPDI